MNELNKATINKVSGGVDFYIDINADKGTVGAGFSISF
jgi:hypothetical protein